jgi:hypothetical protein
MNSGSRLSRNYGEYNTSLGGNALSLEAQDPLAAEKRRGSQFRINKNNGIKKGKILISNITPYKKAHP